jgi:hypothetical protein
MSEIMDYVNAVLIGGMLMLNVLSANEVATETHSAFNGDVLVQEMLITTAQFVEGEFRNIGFGVPELDRVVLQAGGSSLSFLIDLDRDGGTLDTVCYWLGDTTELARTMNPHDRYLHRSVNGGSTTAVGAVTQFRLRYLTGSGEVLSTPVDTDRLSEIRQIEITMEVQNPYAYQANTTNLAETQSGMFSSSVWQQTRLASQNLRR